jgi:hypothetical protein
MEILWLAIIFYSIGLGLILHFRPSLMFHENGTWKEFGYQRAEGAESRHTLFPVWLFAIAWAFVSYVIAAVIVWIIGSQTGTVVAASTASYALYHQNEPSQAPSEVKEEEEEVIETERRPRGRPPKAKAREGYYVLEPASEEKGLRRYVYYGSSPPPDAAAF